MKILIVNDQDEVIGSKERSEIDYLHDIYRVSALWVINSKDEVLIAQRKLTKDKDPGKWGPSVAGTIEENEDYDSNIYKEAEEEIGLIDVMFERLEKTRLYEPRNSFTQWYIGRNDNEINEFTIQEDEVEQLAWISRDELIKSVTTQPEKYIPAMNIAVEVLSKGVSA